MRPPERTIDLTNCDREPIHTPGSIQPHGVLLVLREPTLEVVQLSANAADVFGTPPERLLGSPAARLLDAASMARLTEALESERPEEANPFPVEVGSRVFDGIVHRGSGATLLELEPSQPGAESASLPLHRRLLRAISRLQSAKTLLGLCEAAVREIRRLTGFDRVLIYRFDEEDNGEVFAEDKLESLDSFLGLHYPASDIPRQARQLYLLNWLRIIPDRDYRPVPLVPPLRPDDQQPLDLSFAGLRSVSPVHVEYMRNLGVRASMSISLVRGGRLWGLISCGHHRSAKYVPYDVRAACGVVGRLMSQQIASVEELELRELRQTMRGLRERLVQAMRDEEEDVLTGVAKHAEQAMELVQAGGVAVWSEERCWTSGRVPPRDAIEALVGWLRGGARPDVFETRALSRVCPAASSFTDVGSGLLGVAIPRPTPDYVLWFRPEILQTVNWGGDPTKPVETGAGGARLHPRRSFELWKEVVRGTSLPWHPAEVEAARDLRRYAIEVDLARQVVREQKAVKARDDLVAVVSHDLKNPLGAIQMQAALILRVLEPEEEGPWRRVRNYAERIQRSVGRMSCLIQDLLDLAKIEAGRFLVEPKTEKAEALLEDSLETLTPLADQKHITIIKTVRAGDLGVSADRERVFQVVSNLVGNAIKFTPAGGTIHLAIDAAPSAVTFAVSDTGPGISSEQLPHLFNRYWQAKKRAREGTGLGLYIAKGIVEAHGGRIWAESREGAGSTFFFTLPSATGST